jgi:hypothetical protein
MKYKHVSLLCALVSLSSFMIGIEVIYKTTGLKWFGVLP